MSQVVVQNREVSYFRLGRWRSLGWVGVVCLWSSAVGGGLFLVARDEREAGRQNVGPAQWPQTSRLRRDSARPTLVFAAHPHCPCTAASLAALEQIVADVHDKARVFVVFLDWDEVAEDNVEVSLRDAAARIAGVELIDDRDGMIASSFGALTSGQTYLYDEHGRLVFQGGLTRSRGQVGESSGRLAIVSYLLAHSLDVETTPAYGCPLFSEKVD